MFDAFLRQHPRLHTWLRPGLPYPTGEDREAWTRISQREAVLAGAREALHTPYPQVRATDFLAFVRTGDRQAYEAPYFARRHHLIRTALGECVLWDGSFLDDVVDGLWMMAEETSWVVSAHNVDPHPGSPRAADRPLPDPDNPVIDLFAAQSAATLTLCCHLLRPALDVLTPQVCRRVGAEVERRVLRPFFLRDDFWWMGMIRRDVNNWTPWILSNLLICLLYWERDPWRLGEGVSRVLRMLERYLDVMPADGGCDEGAGYWNLSGASLLDCLELLRHASGGRIDFYDDAKIRAIGRFPVYAHVEGPFFWNFADCDLKPKIDGERVWRFGKQTGDPALRALGASLMQSESAPWPQDTPQMSRVLDRLFAPEEEIQIQEEAGPEESVWMLPDLQVWARREGRYYAAVKAGHNGENHNHNDVGSFLFYIDGEPQVVDAGNMTYTAKTFSPERYTIWNTRSANHNVPLIAGREQCPGREYGAEQVRMGREGITMQLQRAYPLLSGLLRYTRAACLGPEGLRVTDEMQLREEAPVQWVFLLRREPVLSPGVCRAGKLRLTYPEGLAGTVEAYPVTDPRMAQNFPGTLWRLVLSADPAPCHRVEFQMEGC